MRKPETSEEFYKARGSVGPKGQIHIFETEAYCNRPMPYNRRDFYKITYMDGTSRLSYADKDIEIDRPALLFSNPMIPYSWEPISEKQKGYFALFTEEFLKSNNRDSALQDSTFFKIGASPVYFLNNEQVDSITRIFQSMLKEFHSDYIHKDELLRNYLNLIMHEAMKMEPSSNHIKPQDASGRITALFLELLERQFPVDSPLYLLKLKTANQYAEHLSVHVNHLNHAVKDITGKTTTEHISERIITEAKALLQHTDWSVSEIAYSLGFDYPTYFNNFFKKHTGLTPRTLRTAKQVL
jgi:AraC-like DNA-binding protein